MTPAEREQQITEFHKELVQVTKKYPDLKCVMLNTVYQVEDSSFYMDIVSRLSDQDSHNLLHQLVHCEPEKLPSLFDLKG